MQVGVARVLFAMGRDRQLPGALARIHPTHGTPHVAMIAATAVSLVVALGLRNQVDLLASLVNFGALAGFAMLHLSVLVHFAGPGRARRHWFAHVVVPVVGLAVVAAVFSGMHAVALWVGLAWLVVGIVYGLLLRQRGRTALQI